MYGRPRAVVLAEIGSPPAQSPGDKMSENDELGRTRSLYTSTPNRKHSTDDPIQTRSPPTPTRRGQSDTAQGNSAFVRRQLGGMLRSSSSNRMVRGAQSTTSIPESHTSGNGDERGDQGEIQEYQKGGMESSNEVTRSAALESGMDEESTKASPLNVIDNMPARTHGSTKGKTSAVSSVSVTSLPCPPQRYRD